MITTLAVLGRIFSNSVANLYQKKATEKMSPVKTNLYSYAIMSLICLIPACFVNWGQYTHEFWINVIIAGMLCTIGTIALIEALKIGELSVLAPINSYKSIIGLIGAFIILKEIPSAKDLLCILGIVLGSYFVLDTDNEHFSIKTFLRKDIRLRIFALLCSGIEASFLKKIILMSSYKISLILWCFSGFVCSWMIYVLNKEKKLQTKTEIQTPFIIGIMLITMQLTTNYVFTKMEVGTALALFQLSSLVSLYFGYKIYNEKEIIKKLAGTIIMITSASFILF